jgi:hypothetical protein
MKHTGHIGGRDDNREWSFVANVFGRKKAFLFPVCVPMFLYFFGFIALLE